MYLLKLFMLLCAATVFDDFGLTSAFQAKQAKSILSDKARFGGKNIIGGRRIIPGSLRADFFESLCWIGVMYPNFEGFLSGTGTLVTLNGTLFIITAGHVFWDDENMTHNYKYLKTDPGQWMYFTGLITYYCGLFDEATALPYSKTIDSQSVAKAAKIHLQHNPNMNSDSDYFFTRNDVAVITLPKTPSCTHNGNTPMRPLELVNPQVNGKDLIGATCLVAGWGDKKPPPTKPSTEARWGRMQAVDPKQCIPPKYANRSLPTYQEPFLCLKKHPKPFGYPAEGDSGGPVFCQVGGVYKYVGVISIVAHTRVSKNSRVPKFKYSAAALISENYNFFENAPNGNPQSHFICRQG